MMNKIKVLENLKRFSRYMINDPVSERLRTYSEPNFFLGDNKQDKPIYRIFKLEHLLSALKNNVNVLVKPKKWEDPFENFYLKRIYQIENINNKSAEDKIKIKEFIDDVEPYVFGQCWSFAENSDAMWRIYSPDKRGVCVSSTPRKIINSLKNNHGANHLYLSIGEVKYLTEEKIRSKKFESIYDTSYSEWVPLYIETLLTKRKEFSHEEEVRIIFDNLPYSNGKVIDTTDMIEIPCMWHTCIDEIILDPRIDAYSEQNLTDLISNYSGKIKISKSTLYAPL